ncbi:molybdopterin-dependent oxidoreductase [Microbispora sp. H10885]|uniref:molybdopterin-dependent oxidoreductase n=1 Tax=Microbispora sp. H10885 TaxID=2729110 RepID=UPI002872FAE9|nr:molybdopterin-dependent oxidoreductase [Microbispora sp. H10885]
MNAEGIREGAREGSGVPAWAAVLTGLVAAGVALGAAQLVAGLVDPAAAPVVAVGGAVIDATPAGLKEWAIRTFGSADKPVLLTGIVVVLALVAAGLGLLARRRTAYGMAGLAVFGLVGAAAALSRPDAGAAHVLPSLAGAAAGAYALSRLWRRATRSDEDEYVTASRAADRVSYRASYRAAEVQSRTPAQPVGDAGPVGSPASSVSPAEPVREAERVSGPAKPAVMRAGTVSPGPVSLAPASPGPVSLAPASPGPVSPAPASSSTPFSAQPAEPYAFDRRRLLNGVAAGVVVAGAGGFGGWLLSGRKNGELARRGVAKILPRAARPAAPIPVGADLRISGLTPFVTPNADFYRVDTALVVPTVDPARWTLKIHGLVDRPVELTFADLLKRPLTEADVTLTCVSNEVGGSYAGNARWLGARLADVLRDAGIRREADMLLSVSEDGWTCGTPVDVVMDGRDALLAVAMNGEVLPEEHGFPVRQVVPGLYGYVSATKWVTEIRVTRFDRDEAYWTPRGWAAKGPIKTQSRIDLPRGGDKVRAGRTTVAGVAWAQHRGIDAVEVRVDGAGWRQAKLADVTGPDTWRQWSAEVDLTPGRHTISVRATDATGYTQTADEAPPAPDGATGYHSITVTAR